MPFTEIAFADSSQSGATIDAPIISPTGPNICNTLKAKVFITITQYTRINALFNFGLSTSFNFPFLIIVSSIEISVAISSKSFETTLWIFSLDFELIPSFLIILEISFPALLILDLLIPALDNPLE